MAVQIQIAWGMIFIMLAVLGLVLVVLGQLTRNLPVRSWGFVLFGLIAFIAPMFYYLDRMGDDRNFAPTAGDIVLLGTLSFLGGMAVILGVTDARKPQKS
jgi:hypothetical protein